MWLMIEYMDTTVANRMQGFLCPSRAIAFEKARKETKPAHSANLLHVLPEFGLQSKGLISMHTCVKT